MDTELKEINGMDFNMDSIEDDALSDTLNINITYWLMQLRQW